MKKTTMVIVLIGLLAGTGLAEPKASQINLRDVDFDGLMGTDSPVTLMATFDVRQEDLFDEMHIDFYMLLEPDDEEQGLQFFHCRTTHRFLEEKSGYTSGAMLPPNVMKCIDAGDGEYAVVVTYRGEEVGVENSLEERWWENGKSGNPIENVLTRSSAAPMVRTWESE